MTIIINLNCLFHNFLAHVHMASGIVTRINALELVPSMAVDITTLSIRQDLVLVETAVT